METKMNNECQFSMVNLSEAVMNSEFPTCIDIKNEEISKKIHFFHLPNKEYIPLHTNEIHPSTALEFNFPLKRSLKYVSFRHGICNSINHIIHHFILIIYYFP